MPIRLSTPKWILFALFAGLALAACSDGGSGGSLAALGIDDGASSGLSKSATASPDKSVRVGLDTGALVEIPAGAVTKDVKVTLARPADGKALELVNRLSKADERIASAPYVLTPHGTKFQQDVTVKLPLAKKDAGAVSVAWLEDEDDKEWKVLADAEIEGDKAAVKLRHFSVLLLIEDASDLERMDAGRSNPRGEDAAGDVDAGVDPEDADSPDDAEDAEITVERDADQVELDAGPGELDASDGTAEAGSGADGGVRSDAGTGDAGSDGSVLLARLNQCGMVSQQGIFYDPLMPDPASQCEYRCVLSGTCSDLETGYCFGGDGPYSSQTTACIESCSPTPFTCSDQTVGVHCNSYLECANGEDEVGCDPSFVDCGGGLRLPSFTRCDGVPDCPGAEDEIGCRVHVCDGDVVLPIHWVCDGELDCSDATDEPANCAIVMCSGSPDAAVGATE